METSDKSNIKEEVGKSIEYNVWFSELIDLVKEQSKAWRRAFFVALSMIFGIICIVFLYLYQYDFTSTVEQTGVYTLVDSEGNVISSDIPPEQINEILEIINNGKDKENKK